MWIWSLALATPLETWIEAPPLSVDPEVFRALAEEADPEHDPAILGFHQTSAYDDNGDLTRTMHRVYLVRSQDTAEGWGYVTETWSPWHAERPDIQARVIQPDGRQIDFDPTTLVEETDTPSDAIMYSDRMTLQGPLAGMVPGTIVEEVLTTVEHPPLPGVSTSNGAIAAGWTPYPTNVFTVLAPRRSDIAYMLHAPDREVDNVRVGDLKGYRIELGPTVLPEDLEVGVPYDQPSYNWITANLQTTWAEVASAYRARAEPLIRPGEVSAWIEEIQGTHDTQQAQIDAAIEKVRDDIRYVGVELGENAIIPRSPAETLSNGFGDCKDKATVLTSVLRGLGVDAWLTLIETGPGRDLAVDVPSTFAFDHAIVAYDLDGERFFADPTSEYTPVGELPGMDQGRLVLVAEPNVEGLTRTPAATMEANTWFETRELFGQREGSGRRIDRVRATGGYAEDARDRDPPEDAKKLWEEWAQEEWSYLEPELEAYDHPSDQAAAVWTRDMTWTEAPGLEGLTTVATAELDLYEIFWVLPEALQRDDEDDALAERTADMRLTVGQSSMQWIVNHPPGMDRLFAPRDASLTVGPVTYTRTVVTEPERTTVTAGIDIAADRISADDARSLHRFIQREQRSDAWKVEFQDHIERLLDAGEPWQALTELMEMIEAAPDDPVLQSQMSFALSLQQLPHAARPFAVRSVELDPTRAVAWRADALAHMAGPFLHDHGYDWDQTRTQAALDEAIELDPNNVWGTPGTSPGDLVRERARLLPTSRSRGRRRHARCLPDRRSGSR